MSYSYEALVYIYIGNPSDPDDDIYIFTDGEDGQQVTAPPNMLFKNLWAENGGTIVAPLFDEVAAAATAA